MLFIAVLSIFMVICTKINGCPTHRPCVTANLTSGSCIQSKECPYLYRLNNANLTPEGLDFLKKSVCGLDLDKSKLFCCDNNAIRRPSEQIISPENSLKISTQASVDEQELPENNLQTSTPPAPPSQTIITSTFKPPEPKVVYCRTPNGEKAECVQIYQCSNLLKALVNSTEDQKRFLKESGCGFSNNSPLVCCGSDTNFAYNYGERLNFRQNPLIPTGFCGIQGSEIVEQSTVPVIKLRLLPRTREVMNFTLPNRIFGGMNSELSEFPWIALLTYETNDGKKMFACGGSLISSRYVLTAAHCVSGQNIGNFANKLTSIRLGEWDYSNKGRDCITIDGRTVCNEEELNIGVESIHPHPGYRLETMEKYHDIALIRLDQEVKFTKYIRPICLPNIDDYVSPGERLTISGWGLVNYNEETTIKQKVEVPAVSRSQCSVMFERSPRLTQVGLGQFCAGGEAGKDSCVGDSGAPLMRKVKPNTSDSSLWFVEGIVSFGAGCGLVNQYGVYTKVSEYLGWIHNTVVP